MSFPQILHMRYFAFILCSSFLLLPAIAWPAFETKLSDTHIQSTLVKHFPIREYAAFARITLHEPQVILSRDSKDIFLVIPVDANITDQPQRQGHARVAVAVSYKPGSGGLYLANPRLMKFEMPQVSKTIRKDLEAQISTICLSSLPLIQIFRIAESSLNHSLSKSTLKSYSIEDNFMKLMIGFD